MCFNTNGKSIEDEIRANKINISLKPGLVSLDPIPNKNKKGSLV